jgi:hypothetical protein
LPEQKPGTRAGRGAHQLVGGDKALLLYGRQVALVAGNDLVQGARGTHLGPQVQPGAIQDLQEEQRYGIKVGVGLVVRIAVGEQNLSNQHTHRLVSNP